MRRVLQVLGRSAGGIARHVSQVTAALDGSGGLRIDIACPPGLPIDFPKETIELEIPDGPARGHLRAIGELRRLYRTQGYDVVHAHGLRAGIDAGLARAGMKTPLGLLTVHNLVHPDIAGRRAGLYSRAEPLSVRLSDRALAVSADIAARIARGRRSLEDKVEVLYLGIGAAPKTESDPAELRAQLGVPAEGRLVATVARLAPQKALPVLLRALKELPDVTLALLGEGPARDELEREAGALGVAQRVRFLGFRKDVADLVAAADVFCLSSVWEGVPLAAQEAILLGTPVVATAVGGMPELIQDGISGRLVASGDPGALAAALREVLDDRNVAERYAEAASERLERTFSTERMLARLRELYIGGADAL